MLKVYDLPCLDSRKSFYGKAKVIERDNGEIELQSYNTIVCKIDKDNNFIRIWGGESSTTMRHINSFLLFFNINGGGVIWWRSQKIQQQ